MGLAQQQKLLAQLYTDDLLRERFFASPKEIGKSFGLGETELELFTENSMKQIQVFANSLKSKRLGEVRKLLPLTQKSLKNQFGAYFLEFAPSYKPKGLKKHSQEALAFASFLTQQKVKEPIIKAMIRYEANWVRARVQSSYLLYYHAKYPLKKIVQELLINDDPKPKRYDYWQPTFIFWIRFPGKKKLFHLMFTWPEFFSFKR